MVAERLTGLAAAAELQARPPPTPSQEARPVAAAGRSKAARAAGMVRRCRLGAGRCVCEGSPSHCQRRRRCPRRTHTLPLRP